MVRISKQSERRSRNPKKCRAPALKTGPKKDHLPLGFKQHENALEGDIAQQFFIPKIR